MAYFHNLKKLRERVGFTQNGLARKSGVSRDLISKAENGGDCMGAKLNEILNALNEHDLYKANPLNPDECIRDEPPAKVRVGATEGGS